MQPAEPTLNAVVPLDSPCEHCRYNLRGQTATFVLPAAQWHCVCPECGNDQRVVLERGMSGAAGSGGRIAVILMLVVALVISWTLISSLADHMAASMTTYAAMVQRAMATSGGRNAVSSTQMEAFGYQLLYLALPITLVSVGVGIMVSVTPFASPAQRLILLSGCVGVALLMALSRYFSPVATTDAATLRTLNLLINNGGRAVTSGDSETWVYQSGSLAIATLLSFCTARIGQQFGRPLVAWLANLVLPKDMRPEWLAASSNRT